MTKNIKVVNSQLKNYITNCRSLGLTVNMRNIQSRMKYGSVNQWLKTVKNLGYRTSNADCVSQVRVLSR
jgi:hypothetical protein